MNLTATGLVCGDCHHVDTTTERAAGMCPRCGNDNWVVCTDNDELTTEQHAILLNEIGMCPYCGAVLGKQKDN